ncbi:MAG TPA: aminoglycoside phosphotransferase family protein [Gemmataceae bacterium]|nr:aminoglycoside phosphotransferase family protein [Gemmataceae bacterium]
MTGSVRRKKQGATDRGKGPAPREVLEQGLSAHFGRPVRIARLERRPLATSSHPIDRLRVTLASGESLRVIFKRLSPGEELYGNEREVLIYRRLLDGERFGAPALYASVHDEAEGRSWLFLEDLGPKTLEEGDEEEWLTAVRWLARMHGTYHGREDDLRGLGCLMEHGPAYYHTVAQTARRNLELAGAREALVRFDALMGRYDSLVSYLAGEPRTLVHGDMFAANLIIQPGGRIRAIDWESAAVGLGAWELARLVYGWGSMKATFLAAYLAEFERHVAVPFDREGFPRLFGHCEILNALWYLRWSVKACQDAPVVEDLLLTMETRWQRLNKEGSGA